MKKAVIYARVSTEEQADQGKSIETQERLCRKFGEENDFKIISIYKDEGKSATSLNRPALQEMLLELSNHIIDVVFVQDTDRLARNTLDHLTIKAILKKHDVQLISISQLMIDDSPEGNLIDTIIASVNAFQSQITGRKTSKVLEEKAKLGWYPGGLPPVGYRNTDNPNPSSTLDKKIIVPDPPNSTHMKTVLQMYTTGNYTIKDLADYLNQKGVKSAQGVKIGTSTMHNYLKSPFYMGEFLWNGKTYQGKHEVLIDSKTFEKNQIMLEAHNHYASRKRIHQFLLSGFLFCGTCSNRYWSEKHTKKNGSVYDLYFCSHCKGSSYTDTDGVEKQVEKIFKAVELSNEYVEHVMDTAKRLLKESRYSRDAELKHLSIQQSKITKAMREAEDDRFVHKTLTSESFQRINDRYEKDLRQLDEQKAQVGKDYSSSLKILEEILILSENIGQSYKAAQYPQKRKYLNLFFKRFIVQDDDIIKYELSDDLKDLIENKSVRVRRTGLALTDYVGTYYREYLMSNTPRFIDQ